MWMSSELSRNLEGPPQSRSLLCKNLVTQLRTMFRGVPNYCFYFLNDQPFTAFLATEGYYIYWGCEMVVIMILRRYDNRGRGGGES
jgi:hypothetical protein